MRNPYGALLLIVLSAAVGGWLLYAALRWRAARRRAQLRARPLPTAWVALLSARCDWYRCLDAGERGRLHAHLQEFLANKQFIGCNGFELNDEHRLLIAARACLLVVNRPGPPWPNVQRILVYPDAFVARYAEHDGWLEHELAEARAGEAWEDGPVVLSWADIVAGAASGDHDVILHEFAHKLDQAEPDSPGLPWLDDAEQLRAWSEVMADSYRALQAAVARGEDSLLDPYAAESPAEFFAVATETFFLAPRAMRERLSRLYAVLRDFYRLDPASWPPSATRT